MRPCIVGIGGAGGKVLKQFLQSLDVGVNIPGSEHLTFGDVKGLWLDSAVQDAQGDKFYRSLANSVYPGYLICHDSVSDESLTRKYITEQFGIDLKAQGYDRRAEYLKWMFEIFEFDESVRQMAKKEFDGEENPLPGYIWKEGIRPFTTLSGGNGGAGELKDISKSASLIAKLLSGRRAVSGKDAICKGSSLCDSILFIASLGGGTGTGFINPITSYVRKEQNTYPIFTIGILTEKGSDERHAEQGQRYLGAAIAMYDLLTKGEDAGIDMLILMDNQILLERYKRNYPRMDKAIYDTIKPLLDLRNYPGKSLQDDAPALRRTAWHVRAAKMDNGEFNGDKIQFPSIFVPCYRSQEACGDDKLLVEKALSENGQLFHCTPSKAEMAYVFPRGLMRSEDLKDAVHINTGISRESIFVYPKLGDGRTEDVLILLRNPYGGDPGAYKRDGTFEKRIYDVMVEAIKYIEENEANIIHSKMQNYSPRTKQYLMDYFYDPEYGIKKEFERSLERLKSGKKPIFTRPIRIFNCRDSSATRIVTTTGISEATVVADPEGIKKMVGSELDRLLASEDMRAKIREIARQ